MKYTSDKSQVGTPINLITNPTQHANLDFMNSENRLKNVHMSPNVELLAKVNDITTAAYLHISPTGLK